MPVTTRAGALRNTGELGVSPGHRLFDDQRVNALGAGHKEKLVRAEPLASGTTVARETGGFVDDAQLLFGKHEINCADIIAAKSLFVDTRARNALPDAGAQ